MSSNGEDVFEITATAGAGDIPYGSSDALGKVRQELMSIKEMLCLLNNSGVFLENLISHPGLLTLYSKLIKNGVNERYIRYFIEKSGVFSGRIADDGNNIKKRALNEIMRVISVNDPFSLSKNNQTISAFIGTTGVGKTTTIAKLAAMLIFEKKKKVGLFCPSENGSKRCYSYRYCRPKSV
ncbi:MAG: hypothetical protein P8012_14635 [Desulfobacterales bacterium]